MAVFKKKSANQREHVESGMTWLKEREEGETRGGRDDITDMQMMNKLFWVENIKQEVPNNKMVDVTRPSRTLPNFCSLQGTPYKQFLDKV